MKRILVTATLIGFSITTLGSTTVFARGGTGGGGGGGGGHTSGGGAVHAGGGAATSHVASGGGGATNFSANHNLSSGIQHQNLGNQVNLNNTHQFNAQNLSSHTVISGSPQVGQHAIIQGNTLQNHNFNNLSGSPVNQHLGQNNLNHVNLSQHNVNLGQNANLGKNVNFGQHNNLNVNNHNLNFNQQHLANNQFQFGNHNLHLGGVGYKPSFYNHQLHYHGFWHGPWGPWGYGGYGGGYGWGGYGWGGGYGFGYGYQPYFWGLGGWGLGSLIYGSGYLPYYNPYYVYSPSIVYNYAQPIPVAYNSNVVVSSTANCADTSTQVMNSAVAAFKQNDYNTALDLVNNGINQCPNDSVLHEFRGLVLFAKGDYQQAAATVHSVLAVGPGWDWTTLSGLYADVGIYTAQLRTLEAAVKQNPGDGASRFLLAYHYISDGYPDAAAKQLQQVVTLVPNDAVATNLLKMMTSSQQQQQVAQSTDPSAQPTPQPPVNLPAPSQSTAPPVDPATVVGNWQSSRDDGSNFALSLNADNTFKWTFTPKSQPPQSFDGNFKIEGNVIALERTGGGSLVAEITANDGMKFNFKMVGAPAEDPGLTFIR